MESADVNIELPESMRLELQSFHILKRCPKCGHRDWPLPGWLIRMLSLPFARFCFVYCQGSSMPQREITLLNPVHGEEVKKMIDIPCAGINYEHLHVQCTNCRFAFFMETQDAGRDR